MIAINIVLIAIIVSSVASADDDLVININNGLIRGQKNFTVNLQQPYYFFRGIPFAEPPLNDLRFAEPVAKSNWEGIVDATKDKDDCLQGSRPVTGSEDCLYINVYTPIQPSATCTPVPVLLWIYGGGFEGGSSKYAVFGPDFYLEQNVVVVSFNYRLGIFGFFSTGDLVVPGNNGLKDQVLAMQWVRDNILNFCGDPNQVTLAGQSAGSASVAYHLQSPKSQGLFHRAILESGVSLCLWAYSRRVPQVVKQIGATLGVDTSTSEKLIAGLRNIDAYKLQANSSSIATSTYLTNNPRDGFAFGPVSEVSHTGAFFTGKSYQNLESLRNPIPILIGFNSLEGTFNFELIFRLFLVQYDVFPTRLLPIDLNVSFLKAGLAAGLIKGHYFNLIPVTLANVRLMKFLSDDQFERPIRQFARLFSSLVYFYEFTYEGGLWGIYNRTTPGTTHSEELGYLWVSYNKPASPQDFVVRDRMVKLWSNFIKFGNPTPNQDSLLQNLTWKTFDQNMSYVNIGTDLVQSQEPDKTNMNFWDFIYSTFGNPPYDTY